MAKKKKGESSRGYYAAAYSSNGGYCRYKQANIDDDDNRIKIDNALNGFVDFIKEVRDAVPTSRAILVKYIEDCKDKIWRSLPEKEEE